MTSRERFLATLRHQPHDCVPIDVFGFNGYSSPTALGWKSTEAHKEIFKDSDDPRRRSIEQRLAPISTKYYPLSSGVNRYLVIPIQRIKERVITKSSGAVQFEQIIDTPKGSLRACLERRPGSIDNIWTVEYPVKVPKDLEKLLSIPFELSENLETLDSEVVSNLVGDGRTIISSYISSPVVCVGGSMSYDDFLCLCALEPSMVKEFTNICLERTLQVADELLSQNQIDIVWIGGSEWLTPPMSSSELYISLVHEPEMRLIEQIHSHGSLVHVHSHGNVASPIIDLVKHRRADYFEPVEPPPDGNIEFEEAKNIAGNELTLGGNIELSLIENGTISQVTEAAVTALKGRKDNMVLSISAPTNLPTISENMEHAIHSLITVWEEMGNLE